MSACKRVRTERKKTETSTEKIEENQQPDSGTEKRTDAGSQGRDAYFFFFVLEEA